MSGWFVALAACGDVRGEAQVSAYARPVADLASEAPRYRPVAGRPLVPRGEPELTVGCDGSYWSSVASAVAAADDGEVVTVCTGEYAEQIELAGRAVRIEADGAVSLVPADPGIPIVRVTAGATLDLVGLRLADAPSRALLIEGSSVAGDGLVFERNAGGAVSVEEGVFACTRCGFLANGADSVPGGGIRAVAAEVSIDDSKLVDQRADRGGAVFAELGATVTIARSDLAGNAAVQGGVAFADGSVVVLDRVEAVDNVAVDGAVLYLVGADATAIGDPSDPVDRGRIVRNVATGELHGAVELYESEAGTHASFTTDRVFWSAGDPVWNPVDRNLEWDVFFGFLDPEEQAAWGYRFNAIYNEATFTCTTDEDRVSRNAPYPGLCDL